MGSEFKNKTLGSSCQLSAAENSSDLPDAAVYGRSQIPADPSQRRGPHTEWLPWPSLIKHA